MQDVSTIGSDRESKQLIKGQLLKLEEIILTVFPTNLRLICSLHSALKSFFWKNKSGCFRKPFLLLCLYIHYWESDCNQKLFLIMRFWITALKTLFSMDLT